LKKALQALLIVIVISVVGFVGLRFITRRDEIALVVTALAIYVTWEYFEVHDWIHDELGCISYALPILLPLFTWMIFKSYIAPIVGF
jgi:hypothetical protein